MVHPIISIYSPPPTTEVNISAFSQIRALELWLMNSSPAVLRIIGDQTGFTAANCVHMDDSGGQL